MHTRKVTARGHVVPLPLRRTATTPTTPASARRSTPRRYDYDGAVLWQAHAGQLWHRFTIALRRALAAAARGPRPRASATTPGCPTPRSPSTNAAAWSTSTPSSASTAPTDPPTHYPPGSTTHALARRDPARRPRRRRSPPPARTAHRCVLRWGAQLDLRPITPAAPAQLEDDDGQITDAALAGYIAKYATKGTGTTEGADRPIRDGAHIELPRRHRRTTAA